MTDEEMAEEYKRQFYGVTSLFSFSDIEQAFLAGLKAGRPHWHYLIENPNDLPNDGRIVSDQEGNNVKYVEHLNKWFYRHRTCESEVIAWCEIPTFDKE